MLYRKIIAVCSQIHTKHINTLCGQIVEMSNVKPGGTYSDHSHFNTHDTPQSHTPHMYAPAPLYFIVTPTPC